MKVHVRALAAAVLVLLLVTPTVLVGQKLPAPMERTILPGVTTIQYGGQTLIFTTAVTLHAKFKPITSGFELRFKSHSGYGGEAPSGGLGVQIFWEEQNQYIYDGDAPLGWTIITLTEGGWTEK